MTYFNLFCVLLAIVSLIVTCALLAHASDMSRILSFQREDPDLKDVPQMLRAGALTVFLLSVALVAQVVMQ